MSRLDPKHLVEAALLCAPEPLSVSELAALCADGADAPHAGILDLLNALAADWEQRGLELREVAGGWRFQTRPGLRARLERLHPEKPPKYSRAVLETLAIVAHRQPVTRGEIEEIRGVAVASPIMRLLEERGWLRTRGHRDGPGRPALWETTPQFLNDLGLSSVADLVNMADGPDAEGRLEALVQGMPPGTQRGAQLPIALQAPAVEPPAPAG